MNELACMDFSQEDSEQFAQLIGYSVSGFSELSYVSNDTYNTVETIIQKGVSEEAAKIQYLQETLETVRVGVRQLATEVFNIHPDDLVG